MRSVYKHNDMAYIVLRQKPIYAFSKTMDEEPNMELVQEFMKCSEIKLSIAKAF